MKNGLEFFFCLSRPWALVFQWEGRSKVHEEEKIMRSHWIKSVSTWYLCGLGKKQETLPGMAAPQDSECTCWERLTPTFRHDVWMDQQSAFEDNVLFPLPRVCFALWSSVRVYELRSLFGATKG